MKVTATVDGTTLRTKAKTKMSDAQLLTTQYFEGSNGCRLAVTTGGLLGQPPVVLLHGAGQTRHAWRTTAEKLVKAGFQIMAPDIRGHGDSDWAKDGDYRLDTLCADLQCLIEGLPRPPTLIGASLGGHISLALVGLLNDEQLDSLVLVDIANTVNPDGITKITGFMGSNKDGFATLEEAATSIAKYLPHRPKPPSVKGLERNLRQRNGRYFWHWDPKLFETLDAFPDISQQRYDAAAAKTKLPTLLVRGAESELIRDDDIEHIRKLMPHAEFIDIKNAHHMVAGDQNDIFGKAVVAFLQQRFTTATFT